MVSWADDATFLLTIRAIPYSHSLSMPLQSFKHAARHSTFHTFLYILNPGQSHAELREQLAELIDAKRKIEISRGEIELKKVRASLALLTNGATTSLATLAALDLPGRAAALLWLTNVMVNEQSHSAEIKHFIEKRNRDARALLQSLETIHLRDWFEAMIEVVDMAALPAEYQFPPGHPYPKKFYRQHPLADKPNYYYPVDSFFAMLREERETELIHLLATLGASKIEIQDQTTQNGSTQAVRAFEYGGIPWSPHLTVNCSQYRWLEHEPSWQAIINNRLQHQCLSTSFELSSDFSRKITSQVEGIEGLVESFESIEVSDLKSSLDHALQRCKVSVKFPEA